MVQRRRRVFKETTALPFDFGRIFKIAGVVIISLLAIWVMFRIIAWIFSPGEPEPEPVPIPPPEAEVLNGCGVGGIASQMTDYLREHDIDVLTTDNADNSQYAETIIIERDSLARHGKTISDLTGIRNITYDYTSESLVNVTIILGKDYLYYKPFRK